MHQIIFYFIDVCEYITHLHLSQELKHCLKLLLVTTERFIQVLTTSKTIHCYFEKLTFSISDCSLKSFKLVNNYFNY